MDHSQLTDDACDRLIARPDTVTDFELAPLAWFIEDLRSRFAAAVPAAVRAMHPSATGGSFPASLALRFHPEDR